MKHLKSSVKSITAVLTALFTVLAFVLLTSTAVTHHHSSEAESADCAICVVASDKLGSTPSIPQCQQLVAYFLYLVFSVAILTTALYPSVLPCPPGRGPPTVC